MRKSAVTGLMQTFASSLCSRAAPILRVTRTGKPARRRYPASGSKPRGRRVLPSATGTTFLPSRYAPAVVTPCAICSISPFCSDSTPLGFIRAATLIAAAVWCVFTSTITQSARGSSCGPNASGLYTRLPTRTPRRSSLARAALRARADADGRDADALGDQARERRRHQFQHHAPAAGALERLRAFEDAPRVVLILSLQLVAAERRRGLRREADMA